MKETDMPQLISEINTADIPADSNKPDNDFPADGDGCLRVPEG